MYLSWAAYYVCPLYLIPSYTCIYILQPLYLTLHCQKAPHLWRWGHFAVPKSPSYMAMGTLYTAKKPLIYGNGDTLHCQKSPHLWRWGHFALPKSPSYMAMGTLYTAKKPLILGDGDTLHCQKDPHIWRLAHFALPKIPSYMVMGTLCTAKRPLIYGDRDTLHCQKDPHIWQFNRRPGRIACAMWKNAGALHKRNPGVPHM